MKTEEFRAGTFTVSQQAVDLFVAYAGDFESMAHLKVEFRRLLDGARLTRWEGFKSFWGMEGWVFEIDIHDGCITTCYRPKSLNSFTEETP